MHLPVAAFTLLAAALLQDLIPATPRFPVKIVFLTAVAFHAALTRPVWVALTVAVWAGGITDALGGLPALCTTVFLLASYGAIRLMQRVFLEAGLVQGALLTGAASALQMVWTWVWTGSGTPFFALQTWELLGFAVPAGLVAGLAGFAMCGLADRLSGIVKPVKEGNGILWAETDR
jgi:hypothetical protein